MFRSRSGKTVCRIVVANSRETKSDEFDFNIIRIRANSGPSSQPAVPCEASGNNPAFRPEGQFRLLITLTICKTVSGGESSGPRPTELSCRWIDRVNSLRVKNLVRNPMLRKEAGPLRWLFALPLLIAIVITTWTPAAGAQDPAPAPDVVRIGRLHSCTMAPPEFTLAGRRIST